MADLKKTNKLDGPVIAEITGLPSLGKSHVAKLVAKRFGVECIRMPYIDYESYSAKALFTALTQQARDLEHNREWWTTMSFANYLEKKDLILTPGLKIIVNYEVGFRSWHKSPNNSLNPGSLFSSVFPLANKVFILRGESKPFLNDFIPDFGTALAQYMTNLETYVRSVQNRYKHHQKGWRYTYIDIDDIEKVRNYNRRLTMAADIICEDIQKTYGLEYAKSYKLSPDISSFNTVIEDA